MSTSDVDGLPMEKTMTHDIHNPYQYVPKPGEIYHPEHPDYGVNHRLKRFKSKQYSIEVTAKLGSVSDEDVLSNLLQSLNCHNVDALEVRVKLVVQARLDDLLPGAHDGVQPANTIKIADEHGELVFERKME